MAIRNIVEYGDDCLRKKSKPIDILTKRILVLAEDMKDTLKSADGVGLAAPQVGVLRRMVVIDIGQGPIVMINPEIVSSEGEEDGTEGCLSLPGKWGKVVRPQKVVASALNEKGEQITYNAEGLFARAICHELDHLDGILYIDKLSGELEDDGEKK